MTDAADRDISEELVQAVQDAAGRQQPLYINGGGSKRDWLGRQCDAPALEVGGHRGIVDYQPQELVITVRAGTPVADVQALLAQQGQMLACEPPQLDGRATVGGTLASNLSGPARPWGGSLRDAVLGIRLINGRGELLRFGGTVMKNVAGYDVSRLQAGALGTLGVLCELSLRVMPQPEHSLTLTYDMDEAAAIDTMNRRAAEPAPLSGASWESGRLRLRLAGAASAVEHTAGLWGGERAGADDYWRELREYRRPFFAGDEPLWRLTLRGAAAPVGGGDTLLDWGGGQRWLHGTDDQSMFDAAATARAHACRVRGGDRQAEVRPVPGAAQQGIQRRLKRAFDPAGVLNPGRLYGWL